MLVVIPVCKKDEALVLKNLDWVAELDGKIDATACLSYPTGFNIVPVLEKLRHAFSRHVEISYDDWGSDPAWPRPQNWAWQSTARAIAASTFRIPDKGVPSKSASPFPWLWWEADSTPVSKGWYEAIKNEYYEGKKPFMGCVIEHTNGWPPHMNGVGVYPPNVADYSVTAMLTRAQPFDCVIWRDTASHTHRANHLIQHHCRENGDSTHFPDQESVDEIVDAGVVLFHRCKDGSLIDRLRERRSGVVKKITAKISSMFQTSDITVVITNFQRPDKVKEAFESTLAAKVEHVIISASGCGAELKQVHEQFKKQKPSIKIDTIAGDLGCNEMWLRGVRLAKTKWVNILHDDDKLLPQFDTLNKLIANGAPFYHWDALKHAWPTTLLDPKNNSHKTFPNKGQGLYSTDILWPTLLQPVSYSISPVSALFPREHVLETLEEAELQMQDCRFFYSAKMQVGNDLLLWLRAAEEFPSFYYIPRALISYGHWDGSTTFWDYGCNLKLLEKCYDATRELFLMGPGFEMLKCPELVHIQSNFRSADDTARVDYARKAWIDQYRRGNWVRHGVDDNSLPRLFEDGPRKLPYLIDMIDQAISKHGAEPIYVLTNTDTIPTISLTRHLVHTFKTQDNCYSFRRDIAGIEKRDERTIRTNSSVYPGCDLFAFTQLWWANARKRIPDLLYATDTWDYCLRNYMDSTDAKRFYYLIYHAAHPNELGRNRGSAAHYHNHSLAEPFLKGLNIEPYWKASTPPNLNPR